LTSTCSELANDKQTIAALQEQLTALTSTLSENVKLQEQLTRTRSDLADAVTREQVATGRLSVFVNMDKDEKMLDEAARDFKMRLGLRIAAGPDAFFALADTKQEDKLSPQGWLEACKSSLGNVDETLCRLP